MNKSDVPKKAKILLSFNSLELQNSLVEIIKGHFDLVYNTNPEEIVDLLSAHSNNISAAVIQIDAAIALVKKNQGKPFSKKLPDSYCNKY